MSSPSPSRARLPFAFAIYAPNGMVKDCGIVFAVSEKGARIATGKRVHVGIADNAVIQHLATFEDVEAFRARLASNNYPSGRPNIHMVETFKAACAHRKADLPQEPVKPATPATLSPALRFVFDGFGINDALDPFRGRVATLHHGGRNQHRERNKQVAALWIASPAMHQALSRALFALESAILLRGLNDLAPYAQEVREVLDLVDANPLEMNR